jgi:hypothetical protein
VAAVTVVYDTILIEKLRWREDMGCSPLCSNNNKRRQQLLWNKEEEGSLAKKERNQRRQKQEKIK